MKLSEFLGKPIAYWVTIQATIETHGLTSAYEKLAQLEAKLAAHLENEGDECPLCLLEAEIALKADYIKRLEASGRFDVILPGDQDA